MQTVHMSHLMSRTGTQTSGAHTGEVRRKIAPKLTCEFVNYFTGEAFRHRLQTGAMCLLVTRFSV